MKCRQVKFEVHKDFFLLILKQVLTYPRHCLEITSKIHISQLLITSQKCDHWYCKHWPRLTKSKITANNVSDLSWIFAYCYHSWCCQFHSVPKWPYWLPLCVCVCACVCVCVCVWVYVFVYCLFFWILMIVMIFLGDLRICLKLKCCFSLKPNQLEILWFRVKNWGGKRSYLSAENYRFKK
jgi:hypothetical protein